MHRGLVRARRHRRCHGAGRWRARVRGSSRTWMTCPSPCQPTRSTTCAPTRGTYTSAAPRRARVNSQDLPAATRGVHTAPELLTPISPASLSGWRGFFVPELQAGRPGEHASRQPGFSRDFFAGDRAGAGGFSMRMPKRLAPSPTELFHPLRRLHMRSQI